MIRLPYIIAEAGSCHEGLLENALELVKIAKDCEADAVKFQFWSDPLHMAKRRKVPEYTYASGSIYPAWFEDLARASHDAGMHFICSVFLPEDVPYVLKHVDAIKISSFESRDKELCREVSNGAGEHKSIFISSGMSDIWESPLIKRAIRMHCVSAYPTPLDQANLGAIERGMGYSDHTRFEFTGAYAVAAGANYLEVHFMRDETSETCPDKVVSHNREGLRYYIKYAREAALMRGHGRKKPMPCEIPNMKHRVVSK